MATAPYPSEYGPERGRPGSGWFDFAATMLMLAGVFNVTAGIVNLVKKEYFLEGALTYESLRMWGWIWLGVGIVQLAVGFGIFARNELARIAGIVIASLSALAWLLSLGAYPWWGIIIMVINGFVIYGLTAHREAYYA